MKPEDIKIRCSSLGLIMTAPKEKAAKDAGLLSETAKGHLSDVMVSARYKRYPDIANRYTNKGLMVEEDSITLYSRVTKKFYRKNEERIGNEFIIGTPDLYEGESINNAEIVHDVKSSWDIFTFFRQHESKLSTAYYWQLMGYMALTGAKKAYLAYCLIDTPLTLIEDEKRRLMYKMACLSTESPEYLEACDELERNMIYTDISLSERNIIIEIPRDEDAIQKIYEKVKKCREHAAEKYPSFFEKESACKIIVEGKEY